MKPTVFTLLLLVLASNKLISCGPLHLNSEYHSVYQYELILSTFEDGTSKKQFSISSEFDLHPTSKLTYDITLKNVASKELGDSLDQKLVEELKKKFSVTVIRLPVGEFTEVAVKFSDPKESVYVKNIKRGLVALLSVDYRNENAYKTTQSGLLGRCDNEYSTSRTPKVDGQSNIFITRTRLKDTCKASKEFQVIFTDKIWQEVRMESKSDYYYELVDSEDEIYIKYADLEERLSLRYNSFDNLTLPLISQQRVKLLTREKLGANHQLRKRQLFRLPIPTLPPFRVPTLPPFHVPTMPSISSIVNRSREAIDKAVHKVVDGDTTTTLEAEKDYKPEPSPIDDIAERVNRLAESLNTIETEDVEKLKLGYQYLELKNHLIGANKEYLLELFKTEKIKADPRMRRRILFQLLSLLSQHSAFEAAKEIMNNDLKGEDDVKQFAVDTMTVFFTSRTRKSDMTHEQANEVYQFCKESLTQNRLFLYKACYLYFSRMVSMDYFTGLLTLKQVDDFQKNVISDLISDVNKVNPNEDPVKLLLALKSVKNFRTPTGLNFVKNILTNPTHKHLVRADAAWGLMHFDVDPIKDDLIKLLYNQTENAEIRVAIFQSLVRKHGAELVPFVTRLKSNFLRKTFVDDKRVVIQIHDLLRHILQQPTHEGNEAQKRNAQILYDTIREDYKEYLGHTTSQYYYKSYFNGQIEYFLATMHSRQSLVPETYYFSVGDSFDTSQYVVRSLHGNLLANIFPDKSGETPDANIQDAILKMIQELHLSLKERVEHNYVISRHQNHYDVYFMYGDESHHLYPMDLIAYKGNGVHLKFSMLAASATESGLPYYMASQQVSISRILPSNNGVNVLRAVGGYSKSAVFPMISPAHLVSAKLVEETLRTNVHLGFNAEMPNNGQLNLNGSISILNDGETSTSLYYKSQRFINKVIPKDFLSLHYNEVEQFNPDDYEEVVETRGDFRVNSRQPIGRINENIFHIENLVKGFKTVGLLICRKRYNYDIKVSFEPNPPHRALVWNLDLSRAEEEGTKAAKLTLSHDDQKLYSVWIRRSVLFQERAIRCEVVVKDYKKSFHSFLTVDVNYPKQTFSSLAPNDLLPQVQNATVKGSFYTGTDLSGELGKKPEDLYLEFKGAFSKRHDKREIKNYNKYFNLCIVRKDLNCMVKYYTTAYKYNRLNLDVEFARTFAPGEPNVLNDLSHHLFEKYKSNVEIDKDKKTDVNKAHIEFNIVKDLRQVPSAEFSMRQYWGESTFKNIPARLSPSLFGFSVYEDNLYLSYKLPFYWPPTCFVGKNAFETFDGNSHSFSNQSKSCKPKLVVADCSKFKFFVIRNEDSVTVFYDHKYNITFTDDTAYVNGQKADIQENSSQRSASFDIVRNKVGDVIGQGVKFGEGLNVVLFNKEVYVTTNLLYKHQLCGICGNHDGDWSNDIVSSSNAPVNSDKLYETWSFGGDHQCASK